MNGLKFLRSRARQIFLSTAIIFLSLWLVACGGGSSGSVDENVPPAAETNGNVVIGLTDAEGDFHSYTVDVLSVKLIRQNGAEVETLPLSTRVNFAQYTELTEFLTAATVPSGVYTGASLVLDYDNADIIVEDALGNGIEADAIDTSGNALGLLELRVEFLNTDILRIAPGIPAHITLDFDLAASNTIDFNTSPAVVTVEPILIADTILEDPKPHRLRGLLGQVAVNEDVFSIFIRPFFRHGGNFGSLRVHSDDETQYEIDDQSYQGHPGVEALALLDPRSPVVVLGELDRDTHQFTATDVVAGTSIPWNDQDFVTGNVLARSGNELTLSRVVRGRADNQVRHQQLITVLIGDETTIRQQGQGNQVLDSQAISVGQRVHVMGEFSDDLTLDATSGRVRMLYTRLNGNAVSSMPLVVNLQSINHRRASLFDFTGTGTTEDADPNSYEIDTSTLNLSGVELGEPLKVLGHVRPFGSAPEDFSAQTVIAQANLPAKLLINWQNGGTTAPFASQSDQAIVISLDANVLGPWHTVLRAGIATNLLDLGLNPTLQVSDSGRGVFIIAHQGRTRQYLRFAQFSDALSKLLDGVNQVQGLGAHGIFDDTSATLSVRRIIVRVN